MLRVSRLTDYGVVLMAWLAGEPGRANRTSREAAARTGLPVTTVSKLLKLLAREGLLVSHRGVGGGFGLARPPASISVAAVIRALEGPIALTACQTPVPGRCRFESSCLVRGSWRGINRTVIGALEALSLEDLARPWRRRQPAPVAATATATTTDEVKPT